VACGNGEQTLSRDIYRLGHRFDFFRMLSFYFTTVGFYFSSMVMLNALGLSKINTEYLFIISKAIRFIQEKGYENLPDRIK